VRKYLDDLLRLLFLQNLPGLDGGKSPQLAIEFPADCADAADIRRAFGPKDLLESAPSALSAGGGHSTSINLALRLNFNSQGFQGD
jgi:hypothetical protein